MDNQSRIDRSGMYGGRPSPPQIRVNSSTPVNVAVMNRNETSLSQQQQHQHQQYPMQNNGNAARQSQPNFSTHHNTMQQFNMSHLSDKQVWEIIQQSQAARAQAAQSAGTPNMNNQTSNPFPQDTYRNLSNDGNEDILRNIQGANGDLSSTLHRMNYNQNLSQPRDYNHGHNHSHGHGHNHNSFLGINAHAHQHLNGKGGSAASFQPHLNTIDVTGGARPRHREIQVKGPVQDPTRKHGKSIKTTDELLLYAKFFESNKEDEGAIENMPKQNMKIYHQQQHHGDPTLIIPGESLTSTPPTKIRKPRRESSTGPRPRVTDTDRSTSTEMRPANSNLNSSYAFSQAPISTSGAVPEESNLVGNMRRMQHSMAHNEFINNATDSDAFASAALLDLFQPKIAIPTNVSAGNVVNSVRNVHYEQNGQMREKERESAVNNNNSTMYHEYNEQMCDSEHAMDNNSYSLGDEQANCFEKQQSKHERMGMIGQQPYIQSEPPEELSAKKKLSKKKKDQSNAPPKKIRKQTAAKKPARKKPAGKQSSRKVAEKLLLASKMDDTPNNHGQEGACVGLDFEDSNELRFRVTNDIQGLGVAHGNQEMIMNDEERGVKKNSSVLLAADYDTGMPQLSTVTAACHDSAENTTHVETKGIQQPHAKSIPVDIKTKSSFLLAADYDNGMPPLFTVSAACHGSVEIATHEETKGIQPPAKSKPSDIEMLLRTLFKKNLGALPSMDAQQGLLDDYKVTKQQIKNRFVKYRAEKMNSQRNEKTREKQRPAVDKNCRIVGFNQKRVTVRKANFLTESHSVLREAIEWALKPVEEDGSQIVYPNSPLAELWVNAFEDNLDGLPRISTWNLNGKQALTVNHSLLGRRWLWDEGHFTDGVCQTIIRNERGKVGRETPDGFVPLNMRAYCDCGQSHPETTGAADHQTPNRQDRGARRSSRAGTSVKMSSVLSELKRGSLNAHTLISCDKYIAGPEFRYLISCKNDASKKELLKRTEMASTLRDECGSSLNIDEANIQPFNVRVSPDVSFMTDLHCHLSNSEVIGLLGGDYDEVEKCLYIQAAFPCKSTARSDSGFTDVEMDSVSQLSVNEAIRRQGMKVVGWYHSHPKFQPDPSVTDIDNQNLYQNLYGRDVPFVGLIVGTYDAANPSSQSVMRWFHLRAKQEDALTYSSRKRSGTSTESSDVQFPFMLQVTFRNARKYQSDTDLSEIDKKKKELAKHGSKTRFAYDMELLSSSLGKMSKQSFLGSPSKMICGFISKGDANVITDEISDSEASRNASTKIEGSGTNICESMYYTYGHTVSKKDQQTESHQQLALEILDGALDKEGSTRDQEHFSSTHDRSALAYTRQEYEILNDTSVPNDMRASIIWHAVVREQVLDKDLHRENKVPSPSIILERLYNSMYFGDEVTSKCFLADDDAVIVHGVDAMFHHYMTDANKIDVFKCSNFSFDASSIDATTLSHNCREYYKSTIAEAVPTFKLRIGQKITSSLLTWVSHMHLNSHSRSKRPDYVDMALGGVYTCELSSHMEFLGDVMRLLAARWREAAEWNGEKIEIARQPKKPGRKTGSGKDSNDPVTPKKRGSKRPAQGKSGRTTKHSKE